MELRAEFWMSPVGNATDVWSLAVFYTQDRAFSHGQRLVSIVSMLTGSQRSHLRKHPHSLSIDL